MKRLLCAAVLLGIMIPRQAHADPLVATPRVQLAGGIVHVSTSAGSTNGARIVGVWAVLLSGERHIDVPLDFNGSRWAADYWLVGGDPASFDVLAIAVDSSGMYAVSGRTKGE